MYLTNYRQLISDLLDRQVTCLKQHSSLDYRVIIDAEQTQFMLLKTGWQNIQRVCAPYLYVRLENDKVWIEQDESSAEFVAQLQASGVPNQDIVLAFHPPHIRKLTPFAES